MFIVYAVTNIAGTTKIDESKFIEKNKNYLQIDMTKLSVDDFLRYEKLDCIDYILPGDSDVTFKLTFDEYIQTSKYTLELAGSLTDIDTIKKEDIIIGKMPENEYEIVLDKMVLEKAGRDTPAFVHMGVKSEEELLDKKVELENMKKFTIVGFVDKKSPSIYASEEMFVNIISNSKTSGDTFGMYFPSADEQKQDNILDYNLCLEDITLTKGKMPTEDYEVIVNKSKSDEMKINKNIKQTENGIELKVVGYYESKENRQDYLVSNNTVKYNLINNKIGAMVYPKDEIEAINILKNQYNLNVINRYEADKQDYINSQKEKTTNGVIFACIILAISLIEMYLIMIASFLSRIKEIGVLRAIGVKKTDIYKMFLGEIIAITAFASLPGIAFMTYALKTVSNVKYISGMFEINNTTIGICIISVFAFNIIFGMLPLIKILRKSPAKILSRYDIE